MNTGPYFENMELSGMKNISSDDGGELLQSSEKTCILYPPVSHAPPGVMYIKLLQSLIHPVICIKNNIQN